MKFRAALFALLTLAVPASAQVKVSDLPAASTLTGAEVMPGVQSSTSKKIGVSQIGTYVASDPTVIAAVRSGIPDATTSASGLESAADKTKLNGIATGATANSSDAALLARANHTGTQSADTLTDGTTNKAFLATERTKLAGIATGATANSADATLLARANHTGTQPISTVLSAASSRFFGRITAAGGAGEELTGTQATTLLDTVTTSLKGLAPASGGGTVNFLRADGSWAAPPASTGTVSSVSVTTANGVSGSVATATTTPAITLSLGAITPTSVAASGTVTGSNLSGTNTGDQTNVTGNAGTATALATGRTLAITGDLAWTSPTFNGTGNVTAAGTLANTTVTPGTYNLSTITVDSKGRITSASSGSGGTATLADADYGDIVVSGAGTAINIDTGVVTLAKQASVATGTVFYRKTAATGAPEVQTLATLKADLGLTGTNSGDAGTVTTVSVVTANGVSGSVATATTTPAITLSLGAITPTSVAASGTVTGSNLSGTHTGASSGTNTGDQTITLTGAVAGSGTGSFATTLGTNVVGLSNMAQVATGTVFYRKTAATGNPEVQTLATLKTDLGLTGTNSGDQTTITGNAGTATALAAGRTIAMTGDVAWTSPSFDGTANVTAAGTIQAGVVTNAKLANVTSGTFKGRTTAATGPPEDLTGTQATALLDVATGSLKGLMSSSDFTKLAGVASGATANTGTVTSVSGSGGTTGLTLTGGAITTSGTLTLGGTLAVANGGTGVASSTGSTALVLSTQPQFTSTIGVGAAASASGSGVTFPATVANSTDANTLDDYREGSWTPVVTASSGTITTYTASGLYTKIGRFVSCQITISITANGTGAGGLGITLPFTAGTIGSVGTGREMISTGRIISLSLEAGLSTASAQYDDNTYPGGTGTRLILTIGYFV